MDRSLEPRSGDVVIGPLDGDRRVRLELAHADCAAIEVAEGPDLVVWGVVTTLVHRFR